MIAFDSVSLTYPGRSEPALKDVSFAIDPGEFVFLVGPSGSGKSTCIRLMLREYRAQSGSVVVDGEPLEKLANRKVPKLRRRIGAVFQDFRLLPKKTVFENVAFALQVIGASGYLIRTRVPKTLELVGLAELADRMPNEISGGEQQRVGIARAVVNDPTILLADEPTGNLDPETSVEIMKLLDRINKMGTTVVMATHDASIVNQMRKRVIQLEGGQVVRDQQRGIYGQGTR